MQIEGLDLLWPAELDELSSVETAALGSANWQATQRLQAVMSDQKRAKNNRRWLMYAAGAAAVALLLGAGIAWKMREPFILNVPESEVPFVGQMPSADAQLTLAGKLDTAEAWESVIDYFPDQKAIVTIAKQRLAMLYLYNSDHAGDRAKARELCKHFVDDNSKLDEQYRAFGMAGLVIVDFFDNNPQESMKQLAELEALQQGRQLLPNNLSRMLTDVVQANTISIGKERSADWKNLVQKYTNPEEQSN